MKRRSLMILLPAVGLALIAIIWADLMQPPAMGRVAPDLNQALDIPVYPRLTERLYPGTFERDAESGELLQPLAKSFDLALAGQPLASARYSTGKNGSTEDSKLMPDGEHKWISQSYFSFPGESRRDERHPHIKRTFAPDKYTLLDEEVRRYDGTKEKSTHFDGDGKGEHIVDYAVDGHTVLGDRLLDLTVAWKGAVIESERHWRFDKNISLAYSNIRHQDHSRTITFLDEQEMPLRVEEWSKYGTVFGTTVKGFYPGTKKLRFESSSDSYVDTAKYYQWNGTVSHVLEIRPAHTNVLYFDDKGHQLPYEQNWQRIEKQENGLTKTTYRLYLLIERDSQGNMTRHAGFDSNGRVDRDEFYNRTVEGVTYKEIDYIYDEDETLKRVKYWRDELKYPPDREEYHTPAENIRPLFADKELTLNVSIEDNLPIPPPPSAMGIP